MLRLIQVRTEQSSAAQWSRVQYRTVLYCTLLYCTSVIYVWLVYLCLSQITLTQTLTLGLCEFQDEVSGENFNLAVGETLTIVDEATPSIRSLRELHHPRGLRPEMSVVDCYIGSARQPSRSAWFLFKNKRVECCQS